MNEEILSKHEADIIDHISQYMQAAEKFKQVEASIKLRNQLPAGEISPSGYQELDNYRRSWRSEWGLGGWRHGEIARRHAKEIEAITSRPTEEDVNKMYKVSGNAKDAQEQAHLDDSARPEHRSRLMTGPEFLDYLSRNTKRTASENKVVMDKENFYLSQKEKREQKALQNRPKP